YDMIPELFDFDMRDRGWTEKETAISYAQRYLCISESTRNDLLRFYPEIQPEHADLAYCGVDAEAFAPRSPAEVARFKQAHNLNRPYFLFVGSRVQHKAYKNSDLFFNALREMTAIDFDVFCVGGEQEIEDAVRTKLPKGVNIKRVELTDYELSLAYSGAIALVYPSLYEGFGMPVIEAMASGCPVITTKRGSLIESAGDAACFVEGTSVPEMANALKRIQDPMLRDVLRERGFAHAAKFRWTHMAQRLYEMLAEVSESARQPASQSFFAEWKRLRMLQARVDSYQC
ncbi:MAG: glycosyltransferase family 1 protein, partial [Pseudomonadota bacterium]